MRATVLILCLLSVAALDADFSDDAWKEKPIQKVIRLMTEMQNQLDKEAKADEDMYDKLGCWCDTNEKEKTQANAINSQRITDLGASIEELTAKSASLKTDLEALAKQVAESTNSLDESTQLRAKESGEFQAFEVDHIQNMEGLKGALMKLGKVHGDALDQQSLMQVKQILRKHMTAHRKMFSRANKLALIQEPDTESEVEALLQQSGEQSAPQSGAIFGILKQMKESMETNLKSSQDEEAQAKDTFASMKSSKTEEINAANELIASKKAELAATDEKNAASKEDLEDTTATVAADTKFLAELKDKCDTATADYNARSKVRNEEILAVAEAMEILNGDDAKDLMRFTQVSSVRRLSQSRDRAAKLVSQLAKNMHQPKMAALAMSMRLDAFTKVKENIDLMIVELKQTQKDEVEKKDFCGKELHQNEMQTTEKTNTKADLTQAIADLETSKTTLADEIKQLKAEIANAQTEMKRASEIRLAQNTEFQMTVMDQKATQEILAKALDRLKAFYAKGSLLQVKSVRQPGYKKNAGSSSVMTMIQHIIDESKEEQKDTLAAENAAGAAYQTYVDDNNASVEAMSKSVINKSEELAKVDENKAIAEGNLRATDADLLSLLKTYQTLHEDCDFLVKYFDVRQQKRAEEIEALQQAKAIFSGAK